MAYVTVEQVRANLKQVGAGSAINELLQEKIDAAQSLVDLALGFTFEPWGAPSVKEIYAYGSAFLPLPPHQPGSVSAVSYSGQAVTSWGQGNGALRSTLGIFGVGYYAVTAVWGLGPPPAAAVELVLEIAVTLYREKDKGDFSDIVGVSGQGGGVAVARARAFTNRQEATIKLLKRLGRSGVVV